ncbi:Mitochondrial inner membrane protease atp23 [Ascosphaera pollenicola]|nr:Mitochondrial inner membrane protease atp23 [Ascosphaera pollenicola]
MAGSESQQQSQSQSQSQSAGHPGTDAQDTLKNTGYVPGDDAWTICKNIYTYLKGDMSEEGQKRFRFDSEKRNEATDCRRCEESRDYLLRYSPIIRFLQDNIRQLGGNVTSDNIFCRRCDGDKQSGGFDPNYGIVICANQQKAKNHVEDTMAHEMVHLYDYLRFKVDWSGQNLRHAACAEVSREGLGS